MARCVPRWRLVFDQFAAAGPHFAATGSPTTCSTSLHDAWQITLQPKGAYERDHTQDPLCRATAKGARASMPDTVPGPSRRQFLISTGLTTIGGLAAAEPATAVAAPAIPLRDTPRDLAPNKA